MPVRHASQALTLSPGRFLASAWPWRSLAYLATGALLGFATIGVLVLLLVFGVLFSIAIVGLAGFLAVALSGIAVARVERRRLRLVDAEPLEDRHTAVHGLRRWLATRLRESATWRELGYVTALVVVLCWLDGLAVAVGLFVPLALIAGPFYIDDTPLRVTIPVAVGGLALAAVAAYPVTAWAGARAAITRAILTPPTDERARLIEVTRSRARLVDSFEVERRRIERDLHDGAQQRLVALSVQLGLAGLELPPESPAAEPIQRAQRLAAEALAELRELIRGVHPAILTDRGLEAAVREVADRSPVPVDVDLALGDRLPPPVEIAAYFAVVEALANVAKHSGAGRARVLGSVRFDRLTLQIRDDGCGGADPSRGSGLAGLADRIATVDGTVSLASPAGGPTVVHVEIPCGS